eukprot:Filipodium_phascolosomae@DN6959_c0_g1_i1.p1
MKVSKFALCIFITCVLSVSASTASSSDEDKREETRAKERKLLLAEKMPKTMRSFTRSPAQQKELQAKIQKHKTSVRKEKQSEEVLKVHNLKSPPRGKPAGAVSIVNLTRCILVLICCSLVQHLVCF